MSWLSNTWLSSTIVKSADSWSSVSHFECEGKVTTCSTTWFCTISTGSFANWLVNDLTVLSKFANCILLFSAFLILAHLICFELENRGFLLLLRFAIEGVTPSNGYTACIWDTTSFTNSAYLFAIWEDFYGVLHLVWISSTFQFNGRFEWFTYKLGLVWLGFQIT